MGPQGGPDGRIRPAPRPRARAALRHPPDPPGRDDPALTRTIDLSPVFAAEFARLRHALAVVHAPPSRQDHEAAVHAARRCVKMLRACLHLLGPVRAEPGRRAADDALRALSASLSATRDLHVAMATAEELAARAGRERKRKGAPLRRHLRQLGRLWSDRASAVDRSRRPGAGPTPALEAIEALVAAMPAALPADDLALHAAAAYRRTRRDLAQASAHPDPEVVHDARRSLVRHQLQLKVLAGLTGGAKGRLKRLGRLRELLGRHHDLAQLEVLAAETPRPEHLGPELAALVAARQAKLVTQAQGLADTLFDRGAGRYRKRLATRLAAVADPRR